MPGTLVRGIKPIGDKESRLRGVSPVLENMLVYFKDEQQAVINELLLFPDGEHDDLCDAMQLFLQYYKESPEPGVIIW